MQSGSIFLVKCVRGNRWWWLLLVKGTLRGSTAIISDRIISKGMLECNVQYLFALNVKWIFWKIPSVMLYFS